MSPLTVRRFRAERLLRGEFEALRGRVLAAVRARLRGTGVTLDQSDLEACYASAWQGLYAAVLDGEEIDNPAGWLVLVTFRRAIEEHRARRRVHRGGDLQPLDASSASVGMEHEGAHEPDLAAELDDRARLRHLFEGLRGRLSAREREAAVLCYLQGLSRAQAAERMGVSEARMRKLMEGAGVGRPGVAGKVGALVETIRDGGWCEEQGSLMRALAYGILDPEGERYQLALLHRDECPSCRVYVTSLRGLAATLPPVFLPYGLGAAALARVGGAHVGGAAGAAGSGAGTAGGTSTSAALSASGAAGAGAGAGGMAGGGWLFAGAGKLAAGCVLALSVGAGCVALDVGAQHRHAPHRRVAQGAGATSHLAASTTIASDLAVSRSSSTRARSATAALTPSRKASREFGPEQALAAATQGSTVVEGSSTTVARAASSSSTTRGATSGSSSTAGSRAPGSSAAEREFSPG